MIDAAFIEDSLDKYRVCANYWAKEGVQAKVQRSLDRRRIWDLVKEHFPDGCSPQVQGTENGTLVEDVLQRFLLAENILTKPLIDFSGE